MACAVRDLMSEQDAAQHDCAVPVILDEWINATVAVVHLSGRPRRGLRFIHRGRIWEIVHEPDRLRGCVARPV